MNLQIPTQGSLNFERGQHPLLLCRILKLCVVLATTLCGVVGITPDCNCKVVIRWSPVRLRSEGVFFFYSPLSNYQITSSQRSLGGMPSCLSTKHSSKGIHCITRSMCHGSSLEIQKAYPAHTMTASSPAPPNTEKTVSETPSSPILQLIRDAKQLVRRSG
jgi:hypothetical protein